MKLLSIFRTHKGIIIERKNQFGTRFESVFETTDGMFEYLEGFKRWVDMKEYELNVSNEFYKVVIEFLNRPV